VENRERSALLHADDRALFERILGRTSHAGHVLEAAVHLAIRQESGQMHDGGVGAHDEGDYEDENDEREKHHRTSVTPSNMSAGRWMPDAFRRSAHLGRTPVGRNRPTTLPSCVTPTFSKMKISCMVMMSPSMPVISETLVILRVPSLKRVCCTTSWMA